MTAIPIIIIDPDTCRTCGRAIVKVTTGRKTGFKAEPLRDCGGGRVVLYPHQCAGRPPRRYQLDQAPTPN